jgi:hypothetical protein
MNIKHKIAGEYAIKFAKKYEKYFEHEDDYLDVRVDLNDLSFIEYTCRVTKSNNHFDVVVLKELDKLKRPVLND